MKKSIVVTVVFPQTFQFEVDTDEPKYLQQKQIKDHADYLMETSPSRPVIQSCDDPELEE